MFNSVVQSCDMVIVKGVWFEDGVTSLRQGLRVGGVGEW